MKKLSVLTIFVLTIFVLQGERKTYDLSKSIERVQIQQAEARKTAQTLRTVQAIDRYLETTPLKGKGAKILAISDNYSIPASLLLAIARIESSLGRNYVKNNIMGIGGHDNMWGFNAVEDSIEYAAKIISTERVYADFRRTGSIRDLGKVYCPPTWESWTSNVTAFKQEIEESIN